MMAVIMKGAVPIKIWAPIPMKGVEMQLSWYVPCVLIAVLGLATDAQAGLLLEFILTPEQSEEIAKVIPYADGPSRVLYDGRPLTCFAAMETAMRAKEAKEALIREREQLTPRIANLSVAESSLYFPYPLIESGTIYTPDTRTEEQRLADDQEALDARKAALAKRREAERIEKATKQEHTGRLIVLDAQWEMGKACWRDGR